MSRSAKLAVPDWPATDRAAWERAVAVGDLLETPGPAAHWRPKTQLLVTDGYGFWLAWLEAQNLLDRSGGPEERLIPTNVVGYVTDLQTKLAPNSVVIRMGCLIAAIQVMAPQADQSRLSDLKRRLARNARPVRRKADRLRSSVELYQTGIGLMESTDKALRSEATRYRDGLMLALLASRPVRLANFAQIRLGRHLTKHGDTWHLCFDSTETKTHRPLNITLPDALGGYLETYLMVHRLQLLKGQQHDALWISIRGRPMCREHIYLAITTATRRVFGAPVHPHLFRDALATSIAIEDPEHIQIAATMLGHASLATTNAHYNQAKMVSASRRMQNVMSELKAALEGTSKELDGDESL